MRRTRRAVRHYRWEMCGNQGSIRYTNLHPRPDEGSPSSEPGQTNLGLALKVAKR